ncbi:GATOR complex protein WDR59-like isoform X4 [Ostrea edulis]|uniref:GATOR complex protein WDR59-like isoform X4 n=1 Tax=Ostrea edulis TaxID=37623 RepID=UPI0024AF993B|nr:GATOR complex protein WDR59-like isoform X4 [Ostrea edulis]
MTLQWSGEQVVAKLQDVQASAMAVDCLGVWAALAGRRAVTMVNLKKPKEKPIKSPRQSKWDVSCVQWNPHPSHAHLFVTAYNQRLDLCSWKDANISHICSMKGHSRTLSDVGWCPFDVNVIASCSVDTYINLWDVRDPKKPTTSFQTVSGAYQVKWNRVTNNIFATTHEGELRIWDTRKGTSPLQYIAAHLSKIHGLDWNPNCESELATCSQDCSVKFWDIKNSRQCKGSLSPGSPVWRARYTPFGQGIVTVVVPQQLRRGDNSLHLWNTSRNNPVHQFVGHHDVILEFQWRKQQEGFRDHQLVTWSKDQSLRIWKIDAQLQKRCGHDMGDINDSSENESGQTGRDSVSHDTGQDKPAKENDIGNGDLQRQMSMSPEAALFQQPQTLQQEFDLMNTNIPNIQVEEMDAGSRTCRVLAVSRNFNVGLRMLFPENYPYSDLPTFEFLDPNLNSDIKHKLHKVLLDTALMHARRNTSCLEPCLRQLSLALNQPWNFRPEERRTPEVEATRPFTLVGPPNKPQYMSWHSASALQDINIPFPRTSGAKFCSAGYLVVFGRSHEARKGPSGTEITPKSLCELSDFASKARFRSSQKFYNFQSYSISPPTPVAENISIKEWYYRHPVTNQPKGKRKPRPKEMTEIKPVLAPVKIYDSSCMLPIDKELGKNYIIDRSDIPAMCSHNALAASAVGRRDLVQLWSMVSITASQRLKPNNDPDDGSPWAQHPFGKDLIKYLFEFYMQIHDVQTLAMLVCVFWNREDAITLPPKKETALPQSASMEYVPPNMDTPDFLSSSTDSGWPLTGHLQGQSSRPPPNATVQSRSSQHHLSEVSSHPDIAAMTGVLKIRRSNSLSCLEDSFEDYKIEDEEGIKEKETERLAKLHESNCRLLDPKAQNQYDVFLKSYADILYHWGFTNNSQLVLKFMTLLPEPHTGIEFGVRCYHCSQEGRGAKCGSCKNLAFNCSICHIGVKGNSIFCLRCGHGGHTTHILDWFKENDECPTGCSCKCVEAKSEITM